MVRSSIKLMVVAVVVAACGSDAPEVVNPTPVGEKTHIKAESGKKSDELKANSVSEGDIRGIAVKSLQTLQEAYKSASGKVDGVGDVTVMVDDNLNLIIENKSGLGTTTTQVNLKSLDTDFSHLEILSDNQGHEFPGFRIKVLPGEPKVVVKKGLGSKEMEYLEIFLAARPDVEHSISALTFAAQAAQNKLATGR